eukprot:4053085-Pyramimonas_sp.AAC.1
MFERKETCRFDCAPLDVDKIPMGTFLQTYPDEKTKLIIRALEPGEVFGPTVGPAVYCENHSGSYVSVPVAEHREKGSQKVWIDIWTPPSRKPPHGSAVGEWWATMFAFPVVRGKYGAPVHVVEEALTAAAKAAYFEDPPKQAVHWRKRQ